MKTFDIQQKNASVGRSLNILLKRVELVTFRHCIFLSHVESFFVTKVNIKTFLKVRSSVFLYPLLVEYCNPGKVCNRLKEAFPTS